MRRVHYQTVSCTGCGQPLFVLPVSAYPSPEQLGKPEPAPAAAESAYPFPFSLVFRPWGLPLLAAILTLIGVIIAYALILPRLGPSAVPEEDRLSPEEKVRMHLKAGQRALAEGSFRLALAELDQALEVRDRDSPALSLSENRRLNQLHREAALLAALLRKSLEEILHEAATVRRDEEWQAQFRENYKDRAVIFDDVVRREADGRCSLAVYEVRVSGAPARLELGELKLLQALPLERPQRLLFGARIAGVAREAPGIWVVRFRPDSGVLLTDPEAVAACSPVPLDDELHKVLQRQAMWAAELP